MNRNFRYNDGGRAASTMPNERLDCTVRAYALARGISYEESHLLFSNAGRWCSCRISFADVMVEFCPNVRHIEFDVKVWPIVKTFLKYNIYHNIVARIDKHVFCIKENVILDMICDYQDEWITDIWIFD